MPYNKTQWKDHVLDGEGNVVQQGTPVNAENLNNMEEGIGNAVSKDGGDTVTGPLKFKNASGSNGGRILANDGGTSLTTFDNLGSETGDRQVLKVNTTSASDKETAVQLTRIKGGKEETFNVLHSGNKDSIKPEDIGASAKEHTHSASNINSGTLSTERLPTLPVSKGGTGATSELDAFKNLAKQGAILQLNNTNTKYQSDSDSNENAFETWLESLLEKMPNLSSVAITFRCNPAIGGSTYYGTLWKHTESYATIVASTYSNGKEGYVHKVKASTWQPTKFMYQELTPSDIGAAPSGYGLGESAKKLDDWNDATKSGFYKAFKNSPDGQWWVGIVVMDDENHITQMVWKSDKLFRCERNYVNGTWSAWEYTSKRYGTTDLTPGVSPLGNGELYFVYE